MIKLESYGSAISDANDAIALDLNVNNLFDERYYTRFGARNAYTAFGAPRNVLVTARITF